MYRSLDTSRDEADAVIVPEAVERVVVANMLQFDDGPRALVLGEAVAGDVHPSDWLPVRIFLLDMGRVEFQVEGSLDQSAEDDEVARLGKANGEGWRGDVGTVLGA